MTPAQKARLIGFNASLKQRGVLLKLLPDGPEYNVLVQDVEPESEQFTLSEETRDEAIVSMLRDDLDDQEVEVGDTFLNEQTGAHYRIDKVMARPSDFVIRFRCEAAFR